jgi:hypothetical protein
MISSMAGCSLLIGWGVFDERLTLLQVVLCIVLVASGVGVALGTHAKAEIEVDAPRGAAYTIAAGAVMACAMTGVKLLARETHPLLAAWAWEFGAGAILLAPALFRRSLATTDAVAADPLHRSARGPLVSRSPRPSSLGPHDHRRRSRRGARAGQGLAKLIGVLDARGIARGNPGG